MGKTRKMNRQQRNLKKKKQREGRSKRERYRESLFQRKRTSELTSWMTKMYDGVAWILTHHVKTTKACCKSSDLLTSWDIKICNVAFCILQHHKQRTKVTTQYLQGKRNALLPTVHLIAILVSSSTLQCSGVGAALTEWQYLQQKTSLSITTPTAAPHPFTKHCTQNAVSDNIFICRAYKDVPLSHLLSRFFLPMNIISSSTCTYFPNNPLPLLSIPSVTQHRLNIKFPRDSWIYLCWWHPL